MSRMPPEWAPFDPKAAVGGRLKNCSPTCIFGSGWLLGDDGQHSQSLQWRD
jgi:hypothetical protein